MPLTTVAPSSVQFNQELSENARLFLVGVKTYDHFSAEPVASAHNNVVSWLIQGLRMGISPHGNHVHLDLKPEEIQQIASDVLVSADLTERVRQYARIQIDAWTKKLEAGSRWDDWGLSSPTFSSILGNLLDHANHVQGSPDRRLLVVFCGHGALSQGRFVLCPRDAVPADARTVRTNEERQDDLLRGHTEHKDALTEMFRLADKRGATAELLDLLEASPIPFQGGLCLSLQGIAKNLRRLPKLGPKLPEPSYLNVITPVHLLLALGGMDERVTFVLDACHSGGLQDTLQGSQTAHDWTALGLESRVVSASQKSQRAAEATLGDRRYSAATWALTRVLSRWEPVEDGPAYAMGITNGNLVNRANMLLDALSFNQQITLSAPDRGRRRAADLPFFGLRASTETTVDPNADSQGIQLSAGGTQVWAWTIKDGSGTTLCWFLAPGSGLTQGWNSNGTYYGGGLNVFTTKAKVNAIAGLSSFSMTMYAWNAFDPQGNSVPPPTALQFATAQQCGCVFMQGSGDNAETEYTGAPSATGLFSYLKSGGTKTVYLQFLASDSSNPARLRFVTLSSQQGNNTFPYVPSDFADGVPTTVTFNLVSTAPTTSYHWRREITYST